MNRNTSTRRYVNDSSQQDLKPSGTVNTKRRALGDITNSVTHEEPKDKAFKKPVVSVLPSIQPEIEVVTTTDVEMASEDENTNPDPRIYMQRASDDIDSRDSDNPVLATAYVQEMYCIFRGLEREHAVNAFYMQDQPHINDRMRAILVDWLIEVHLKFKMVPETLYLTVAIIDRYLVIKQVRRSKLQLVGVAALQIASKYEEIYPPELRDLVYITDRAYTRTEILDMETEITTTLDYQFTLPTTHAFLCRFLKAAHADRAMVQLACYLSERSLQEYTMLKYLPSIIAASSVLIARKSLKRHPWSPTLLTYTTYDEPELAECINDMKIYFETQQTGQQQAVQRKYSSSKFGGVAKFPLFT